MQARHPATVLNPAAVQARHQEFMAEAAAAAAHAEAMRVKENEQWAGERRTFMQQLAALQVIRVPPFFPSPSLDPQSPGASTLDPPCLRLPVLA